MSVIFLCLCFILSVSLSGVFRRYALQKNLLDIPNHRSSHAQPTPKGGGLVFATLWLLSVFAFVQLSILPGSMITSLVFPAAIVMLLGYWDDMKNLPAKLRFAIQLSAAMLILYALRPILPQSPYWLHVVLTTLFLLATVWSTNLFNFMDGTDGYAAVEAIFIFGVGGYFFWYHDASIYSAAFALVAVMAGFLVWNWPRAKLFMGDVGSGFLGFLLLPFALIGQFQYHISLCLWFILYLGFSTDATVTLIRRVMHGEKWYEAHKSHAYQRLHQSGLSHTKVLLRLIVFNLFLSGFALVAFFHPKLLPLSLIAAIILSLTAYFWVERIQPMQRTKQLRTAVRHENYS